MALLNLVAFIYLFQWSVAHRNMVPVLMLDENDVMIHNQISPNPLEKMSSTSFADIVHESIERSDIVIMFVEEGLCVEDVCTKDKYGSPFVNLRTKLLSKKAKYFPTVIEPYKTLKHILPPQDNNIFYLSSTAKLQLVEDIKYIYVFFHDGVNETRAQTLRRHDALMKEVMFVVKQLKPGNAIGYYTGKINPVIVQGWDAIKNKSERAPEDEGITIVTSRVLYKFGSVSTVSATRRMFINHVPRMTKEIVTANKLVQGQNYQNFDLRFAFKFDNISWILEYVALFEGGEEVGRTTMRVGAPWNYSYFCPDPINIINTRDGSYLAITSYRIEPKYRNETTLNTARHAKFGPSVHCGPYFSANLLACFMVTLICLGIAMYGIVSLMDCLSNGRYEDPNSKPLTHEVMH